MLRWTCNNCPTRYCSLDCTNYDKRDNAQVCGYGRYRDYYSSSWASESETQYQDFQHRHGDGGSHTSGQHFQSRKFGSIDIYFVVWNFQGGVRQGTFLSLILLNLKYN